MATLSQTNALQILHSSNMSFFTTKSFSDLFGIPQNRRLYQLIENLTSKSVLEKFEKGKYHLQHTPRDTFQLANFLYSPSYVSFESALNFYGILSQFPYIVSSATPKKNTSKNISDQTFTYEHLSTKLFFGFTNQNGSLIAEPEKALLDQTYFHLKKLKGLPIDEYDLSNISKPLLKNYSSLYPNSVYQLLKKYL